MNNDAVKPFLQRAVAIAAEHSADGRNGPFGAVVTRGGEIVAEGWNQVVSGADPTAHAEVVAIRRACAVLGTWDLSGCEIHASCEPCPMCLAAVYWARIDRIFFAATRHQAAAAGFQDQFLYEELRLGLPDRRIPTRQVDLPEAGELLSGWVANPRRVAY